MLQRAKEAPPPPFEDRGERFLGNGLTWKREGGSIKLIAIVSPQLFCSFLVWKIPIFCFSKWSTGFFGWGIKSVMRCLPSHPGHPHCHRTPETASPTWTPRGSESWTSHSGPAPTETHTHTHKHKYSDKHSYPHIILIQDYTHNSQDQLWCSNYVFCDNLQLTKLYQKPTALLVILKFLFYFCL